VAEDPCATGSGECEGESRPFAAQAVASFSLIEAATAKAIAGYDPIASAVVLDLATLPAGLSIRANTAPSPTGSVLFALDGSYQHTENLLPYALCGDTVTSYAACPQLDVLGSHTLTATPYSGANLSGSAGSPATLSFTVNRSGTVPSVLQWSIYELPLTAAHGYGNPYTDVTVTATFTSPSGVATHVQGFWDGASTFKVRFAPPAQGAWSYAIQSSPADAGLTRSGKFDVIAPASGNHGFLRRDAAHPYSFVFDDQARFFVMGQTYYGLALNALDNGDWQSSVKSSHGYGFNKIRMNLFTWVPGTGAYYGHPYAEPFTSDHDHVNLTYWQKVDQVISFIESQGMVADLIVFVDDAAVWGTSAQNDRYLRYAIARYASHHNLTWCVSNEWNYTGQPQSELDHLGSILAAEDPYASSGGAPRARSVHQQTRIDFQFFGSSWPAHAIIQYGPRNGVSSNGDQWGNSGILYNRGHGMPVVNDEYGYIDPNDTYTLSSGVKFSETRTTLRNAIWGIAMAGGFGTFGGDNTLFSSTSMPIFSGDWIDQPGYYGDIRVLTDFFNGISYWRLAPQNGIVSGNRVYAFGTSGNYVVYAAAGGTFTIGLAGACAMSRLDPRTGALTTLAAKPQGALSVTTPDGQDYAYHLSGTGCQ
jgi:hypothetical protein